MEEVNEKLLDRRVAPMIAGMHSLPKTTLISADEDPLRDEIYILASVLERCNHIHFTKTTHGFATFHFLKQAKTAHMDTVKDIEYLFNSPDTISS